MDSGRAGEKWADHGLFIFKNLFYRSFCDHMSAVSAGARTHLNDPVGFRENLGIVVHKDHGVAVRDQIPHDSGQSHDVGGVQTDGGLIQHVQNARCPVTHSAGQLHPLPFAGGEGGGGTVQGQIAESQIKESLCRSLKRFTDAFCHGAHLFREGSGNPSDPFRQV